MEKTLNIDGRQVKFKSTGAFLLRYKAQFNRDAIHDIYSLERSIKMDPATGQYVLHDIGALELETLYNLTWTLAKIADPSIPLPMEWLDGFSAFPLDEIMPEVIGMILSSFTSTVEPKKK